MRLSDLLGADVVDEAGRSAGHVHDVRLVQDGPLVGGFGASLRVGGLIVGRRSIGARLGYERREMRGPLVVKLAVGWHGGAGVGPVACLARWVGAVRLSISGSWDLVVA